MSTRCLVVDLSSNNTHPINYEAAVASGLEGAIIKLTEGSDYANPDALEDLTGFRAKNVPVAGYHFFHPELSIASQLSNIKKNLHGVDFVWVDSELDWQGKPSDTMTPLQWQIVARTTQQMLEALKGAGIKTGLYSNPDFLDNMQGSPWGYNLWLADYGPASAPMNCLLWQFTRNGNISGINSPVDLSYFYGTLQELESLFNKNVPIIGDNEVTFIDTFPDGQTVLVVLSAGGFYDLTGNTEGITWLKDNGVAVATKSVKDFNGLAPRLKNLGKFFK